MRETYISVFELLGKQYTVLSYERERLRAVRAKRGTSLESNYEQNLQIKIDALNDVLRGLAKLLEL